MLALGIVPDPKGMGSTLSRLRLCARLERGWALRGTAGSLGTFSSGRRLHTIPYHGEVAALRGQITYDYRTKKHVPKKPKQGFL